MVLGKFLPDQVGDMVLLAAIIQRNDNQTTRQVISAAAASEMMEKDGFRSIAFLATSDSVAVSVIVVYEQNDGRVEVFTQVIPLVPL
jgi:hypothetical protein